KFSYLENELDNIFFRGSISYPENLNETNSFKVVYPAVIETSDSPDYLTLKISGQQVQHGNLPELSKKGYFIGEAQSVGLNNPVNVNMSFPWAILRFNIKTAGLS